MKQTYIGIIGGSYVVQKLLKSPIKWDMRTAAFLEKYLSTTPGSVPRNIKLNFTKDTLSRMQFSMKMLSETTFKKIF